MPYEEDKHPYPYKNDEYFEHLVNVIQENYNHTELWFKSGRDKRKYHIMKNLKRM